MYYLNKYHKLNGEVIIAIGIKGCVENEKEIGLIVFENAEKFYKIIEELKVKESVLFPIDALR